MLPWLEDPTSDLLGDVRDTSLAKLVRDDVLRAILCGELPAGSRINEPDVAARLQISRVPVREALRGLESSGLVSSRKNVGAFVRDLAPAEVAELYELRAVLDGHAALRAAMLSPSRRTALVKRLAALVRKMKGCVRRHDAQAYYPANLLFHWMLVEATDNERFRRTYKGIVQQLHLYRLRNLSHDLGMRVSTAEHEEIVEAVADGDTDRSRSLAEAHVGASHRRLVDKEANSPARATPES